MLTKRVLSGMALFLCMCSSSVAGITEKTWNIIDFGAIGNGQFDCTAAIQRAVDSGAGGRGLVLVPAGRFLTGSIELKSGVTLRLQPEAVLLGSGSLSAYPVRKTGFPFYGEAWARYSLLFCRDAANVVIEGSGTIDGQGSFFAASAKEDTRYEGRPFLLWFVNCTNITVKQVQLRNSAFWMQYYLHCDNLKVLDVSVWNHCNKNNDMIDIDGCRNVRIERLTGDSDDDGITFKSTTPRIGRDILVKECRISSHCNAIKFGTESTGGYENVKVEDCYIGPSAVTTPIYGLANGIGGIAVETVDGAVLQNISFRNIVIDSVEVPLFVRLGNRGRKHSDAASVTVPGKIGGLVLENIIARGAGETGCSITGIPEALIDDIQLKNLRLQFRGGSDKPPVETVAELIKAYPEPTMFGKLPSYGIYFRHVRQVRAESILIEAVGAEPRPAIQKINVLNWKARRLDTKP